jgi:hypothetical protein
MFDSTCQPIGHAEAMVQENPPEQANSHTCPVCGYVNWCTYDPGHSGLCHCDRGHTWQGSH